MADTNSGAGLSISRLVLVPGLITLAVTILRLVGELQHWSKLFFNPAAGGGGAILGISWLPIILGPYFALKLAGAGERPAGVGRAFGFTFLALAFVAGGFALFAKAGFTLGGLTLAGLVLVVLAILTPFAGWPALAKALLAYGYLARIPVAILMYFALRGNWGTHYDATPPGYPPGAGFGKEYIQLALVPQLTGWVAFTVIIGSLCGAIVYAVAGRKKALAQA